MTSSECFSYICNSRAGRGLGILLKDAFRSAGWGFEPKTQPLSSWQETHPRSVLCHHSADETVERVLVLGVAMVMRAAAVAQAEALGSVHGVGRRLGIRGNGERLDDVADAGVQRYQPPGETEGNATLVVPGEHTSTLRQPITSLPVIEVSARTFQRHSSSSQMQ